MSEIKYKLTIVRQNLVDIEDDDLVLSIEDRAIEFDYMLALPSGNMPTNQIFTVEDASLLLDTLKRICNNELSLRRPDPTTLEMLNVALSEVCEADHETNMYIINLDIV